VVLVELEQVVCCGEGIVVKEEAALKLARAMAARALENDE
jgi:hypothetical protein